MSDPHDNKVNKPSVDTPFPRRWIFYILLKFLVIAVALVITLSAYGLI